MPVVRISGWEENKRPSVAPESLMAFLKAEAGMDSTESEESTLNLMKGKFVEAYFDYGENEAARAFSTRLDVWGLKATIQSDKEIEKNERAERVSTWAAPGIALGIFVIGTIIQEPFYGIGLFILAAAGVGFFFVIRSRNLPR